MRAIVISDSHGDSASINMVLSIHRSADMVIFLGDGENDMLSSQNSFLLQNKKLIAVKGNCDFGSSLPNEEVFAFGGKKILALHGHTKYVKHGLEALESYAQSIGADIAVYGHTHSEKTDYINGVYYMCPGSIKSGSYGIIDLDEKTNTIICYTTKL